MAVPCLILTLCLILFSPGGVSMTVDMKTAHRIWLRMLSIALEEEINVLDFA